MSTATIVEPTGVDATTVINKPRITVMIEMMTESMITPLKLFITFMLISVGKIISADIRSEPTSFIDTTITTPIIRLIKILYRLTLRPDAFVKSSSNVILNILL